MAESYYSAITFYRFLSIKFIWLARRNMIKEIRSATSDLSRVNSRMWFAKCRFIQWRREINVPPVQSGETVSATVFRARVHRSPFAARRTFACPATRSAVSSALSPAALWANISSPFRDPAYRAGNPFSRESLEPLRAEARITRIYFKSEKFRGWS